MDSSSESASGRPLRQDSQDNGRRTSSGTSPMNVEIEITSDSGSSESHLGNLDGCQEDDNHSVRLEMDLFANSQHSVTTSSYSSSDKYSEDYLRLLSNKMIKANEDAIIEHENSETSLTTGSSSCTDPASLVSDVTHESLVHNLSPMQSPVVQVMDQLEGYDPGRIPSAVFDRSRCSTPNEWSLASNESLFSIHIGNNTFSKDQTIMLSAELEKSGELSKSNEVIAKSPLPQVDETFESTIAELEKNFQENKRAAESVKDVPNKEIGYNMIAENRDNPVITWKASLYSDKSETYAQSSSLPVKKNRSCLCLKTSFRWLETICCWAKNSTWPSCSCATCKCPSCNCSFGHGYRCDCRCLTCCFRWPTCHIRWPNCRFRWPTCCCSYGGCCGCNCSSCCDWSCCSKECCFCCCPSKTVDTKKENQYPWSNKSKSSSCLSCHSSDSCCCWGC